MYVYVEIFSCVNSDVFILFYYVCLMRMCACLFSFIVCK